MVNGKQWSSLIDVNTSLRDTSLSGRVINILGRNGITTLGQLIALNEKDIINLRRGGKKFLEEIKNFYMFNNIAWPNEEISFGNETVISDLPIPDTIKNALLRYGFRTFADLVENPMPERIYRIGPKGMALLNQLIESYRESLDSNSEQIQNEHPGSHEEA